MRKHGVILEGEGLRHLEGAQSRNTPPLCRREPAEVEELESVAGEGDIMLSLLAPDG